MNNDKIFRTAALELQGVDGKEVVKVAGLVRRLKNWFKKHTDKEYAATVDKLNQDSAKMKGTITALYNEVNFLQNAIKDGELNEYNTRLNNVKELAAQLWHEFKQTSGDSKDYYTLQDMAVPGFEEWFKKYLPKGYDLEMGEIYNKPLKETKWYAHLAPQQITLREGGAFNHLLKLVREALVRDSFASPAEANKLLSNKDAFIRAFQSAVVNGVLITADIKKPSKEIERHMAGATEIQVTTAPFTIPGSDIQIQAKVDLIDLGTTKSSRNKMSLRRTHYVVTLGNPKAAPASAPSQKAASRFEQLKKIAFSQEVPYKATRLSEVQLAEALRKGHQIAFGSDPTAEVLAGGWAQVSLENGRGQQIYNNNFGNVKATDDWIRSGKSYAVKETDEFTKDGKHYKELAKWKVYPSPEEGAAAYWRLIGNRYKNSMDWMAAGDPASASVSLAMKNYYTANIQKYSRGVSSLYNEFMNKIAPQLSGLKSMPSAPPGEKPQVKAWVADYSKAEQDAVVGGKSNTRTNLDEVDSLINTLYADDSVGPLDRFVKQAILKEVLPNSKLLIVVNADNDISFVDKTEYVRVAGYVLSKFLGAATSAHTDGKNLEIQCSILGTPLTTTKAVQAICDCVSDALELKKGIKISSMVVPGFLSKYSGMDINQLYRNQRINSFKSLEK